jgi:hypothetical protein
MLPGVVQAMLHYQLSDPTLDLGFVSEFRPFYSGAAGWLSVGLMLGSIAVAIWNRDRLRRGEWVLLIAGIALLLRLGRFAPVYAILAAPVLASVLPAMSDRVLSRRLVTASLALVLVLGSIRLCVAFPARDSALDAWLNRLGEDTPGYPTAAARFVDESVQRTHGRLLNEFTWGGYLSWRFGSKYQVLMDGRTQLYSSEFWRAAYGPGELRLSHLIADTQADAAILPSQRSRLRNELLALGWQSVYRDSRAEVLVPPANSVAGAAE